MNDDQIKAALGDRSALALTMYGEARGVGVECRIAVGCVVRNRLVQYRKYRAALPTYKSVCLAPMQFSCWNGGDANYAAIMAQAELIATNTPLKDPILKECLHFADGLIGGSLGDNTGGSTFYVEKHLLEKAPPIWTTRVTQTCEIGPFVLFKDSPEKAA